MADLVSVIKAAREGRQRAGAGVASAIRKAEGILADYTVSARVKDRLEELLSELKTARKAIEAMGAPAIQPEIVVDAETDSGTEVSMPAAGGPSLFRNESGGSGPSAPAPDPGTMPTSTEPTDGGVVPAAIGKTWDDAAGAYQWRSGFGGRDPRRVMERQTRRA